MYRQNNKKLGYCTDSAHRRSLRRSRSFKVPIKSLYATF